MTFSSLQFFFLARALPFVSQAALGKGLTHISPWRSRPLLFLLTPSATATATISGLQQPFRPITTATPSSPHSTQHTQQGTGCHPGSQDGLELLKPPQLAVIYPSIAPTSQRRCFKALALCLPFCLTVAGTWKVLYITLPANRDRRNRVLYGILFFFNLPTVNRWTFHMTSP